MLFTTGTTISLGLLSLRTLSASYGGLPQANDGEYCRSQSSTSQQCLLAGSHRINFLPLNAAMYTMWMRQHNLIAGKLKQVNPTWSDEQLFQESRRIVVAQIQHITYNEFVPVIVGKENLKKYALDLQLDGYDSRYDINVDASTLNVYAAAVGQFFFSLLPNKITVTDSFGTNRREEPLGKTVNNPSFIYQRNRLDAVLRFLIKTPIVNPGLHFPSDLRNTFKKVQMGRDHGIPGYLQWRRHCNLEDVHSFTSLASKLLPSVNASFIEELYGSPENIDLIVGGLAEAPQRGALLGPTLSCLFARQMQSAKRGDRFWYENFFYPAAFSTSQLDEIRKTTLARILCDNADDIRFIQPNVLALQDEYGNCPVSCSSSFLDSIDFFHWKDEEPKRALPITKATVEKAIRLGIEQYKRLQEAERRQIRAQALFSHASLMAPKKESLEIAKTAGVLREATRVLLNGAGLDEEERLPIGLDVASLQKLLPDVEVERIVENFTPFLGKRDEPLPKEQCLPQPLPCDHTTKYRSYSGWCNNLHFPKYGNAFGALRRLLEPAYDDGVHLNFCNNYRSNKEQISTS
uniref:Animal hem peroxidase n=1 Tax=Angiostrongylus cantonensis TaxID=6313 RepID=A0A0K0CYS3_ANGCA